MNNYQEQTGLLKWGNGKRVLIFLHYFGGDASCWKWVVEKLPPQFTCMAFNLPGCGGTPSLDNPSLQNYVVYLQTELHRLNIFQYTLIGHSMGGKIAMLMASNDTGNNIEQLILIAPSPPGVENISPADKIQLSQVPSVISAAGIIEKLIKRPLTKLQLETAVNAQVHTDENVREWWIVKGSQQSILNEVYKIHCPITVLCSLDDPAISYSTVKKDVVEIFENTSLFTIRNVGHLYPLELPGWVADAITGAHV